MFKPPMRWRGKGLLIDTNVLVLYVVGRLPGAIEAVPRGPTRPARRPSVATLPCQA